MARLLHAAAPPPGLPPRRSRHAAAELRAAAPSLEALMQLLVARAKLLLSLRSIVLEQQQKVLFIIIIVRPVFVGKMTGVLLCVLSLGFYPGMCAGAANMEFSRELNLLGVQAIAAAEGGDAAAAAACGGDAQAGAPGGARGSANSEVAVDILHLLASLDFTQASTDPGGHSFRRTKATLKIARRRVEDTAAPASVAGLHAALGSEADQGRHTCGSASSCGACTRLLRSSQGRHKYSEWDEAPPLRIRALAPPSDCQQPMLPEFCPDCDRL